MNFNLSGLKKFSFKPSRVRRDLFLEPGKLWGKFIWFLIFFSALAFLFDGWVFYRFYFNHPQSSGVSEAPALKPKSLNKALESIEKKKSRFESYKNNLIIEDPS